MRKIFLTVVLTSLFWLGVYDLVQDNQPQSVNVDLAAASEGVSEEGGETYLEVYGHEYFAGKYRKSE